ncbi:MAG: hypothetical protein ACKPKO_14835, partial [Candidatus Fonsibacter sp.]
LKLMWPSPESAHDRIVEDIPILWQACRDLTKGLPQRDEVKEVTYTLELVYQAWQRLRSVAESALLLAKQKRHWRTSRFAESIA